VVEHEIASAMGKRKWLSVKRFVRFLYQPV
jgi:hypothetical protein